MRRFFAAAVLIALCLGNTSATNARLLPTHTALTTTSPIQHLVIIFQENISFDHYFATYPNAANTDGTTFHAKAGTPSVNGLNAALLSHNPNSAQPQRLGGPNQIVTCDQDHNYKAEQQAFDSGLMDTFVEFTGSGDCSIGNPSQFYEPGLVMDYYDGNTVTAMWNYAQRFAMSDNSFGTGFGPSTPGAINLISGQTHGVISLGQDRLPTAAPDSYAVAYPDGNHVGTIINDPDPAWDDCSNGSAVLAAMQGQNIGDLLNAQNVTWGWFQGGFRPTGQSGSSYDGQPKAVCSATTTNYAGASIRDYSAHHEPFQYYQSTANPHHLPPSNVAAIGTTDQAHHQYDLADFYDALNAGNLPAVSFLKAPSAQDGHAGYSSPLDEQQFVVDALNRVQQSSAWATTAVIIAYDDSDGWYDHSMPPIINSSAGQNDALQADGKCGNGLPAGGYLGRCGYGPRLPLLVLSPYSKPNFVDHTLTDQTSIIRFIEDNWLHGQRLGDHSFDEFAGSLDNMFDWNNPILERLMLVPTTGGPAHGLTLYVPEAMR